MNGIEETKGETVGQLIGGEPVLVTFRANPDAEPQAVFVRELPVKEMPDYLGCHADEMKSVELFCKRPAGWAETLTRDSFERVLEKGEAINLPFLQRFAVRAARRQELMMPGLREKIEAKVLEKAISQSLPSSPTSPPKAG